jgi:antibiotic biosynthesis monooxygenase (ABM) superfamily enzyme
MSDQDCCTYECEGNKHCPVRATRRVRAGQPPADIDLWVDDLPEPKELPAWKAVLAVAAIIVIVALFVFGLVSVLP